MTYRRRIRVIDWLPDLTTNSIRLTLELADPDGEGWCNFKLFYMYFTGHTDYTSEVWWAMFDRAVWSGILTDDVPNITQFEEPTWHFQVPDK